MIVSVSLGYGKDDYPARSARLMPLALPAPVPACSYPRFSPLRALTPLSISLSLSPSLSPSPSLSLPPFLARRSSMGVGSQMHELARTSAQLLNASHSDNQF